MASITVSGDVFIDTRLINLYAARVNAFYDEFADNVYETYNGVTYQDVYAVGYATTLGFNALYFAGSGFNAAGTAGSVTGIIEEIYDSAEQLYGFYAVQGLALSAAELTNVSLTSGSSDDYALLMKAFGGNDTINLGQYADYVDAGAGADLIKGYGGNDTLRGGSGNDTIDGGLGSDYMVGGTGNDLFYVNSLSDRVVEVSTGGTDTIYASTSYTLPSYVENARINTAGTANVTGNGLSNTLYAGAGNNVINGGAGTDTVSYAYATAGVRVSLATTAAQATGGSATDTISGVERLVGTKYNDALTGNGGANLISGGAGNDVLWGSTGNDVLSGGVGLDTFRFASPLSATTNVDAISDFVAADDRFLLSSSVFTKAGPTGTLASGAFRIGTAAGDSTDRIVYDKVAGKLYYDADGSGAVAAKVLFATVLGNTTLTNADFVIG
jgi:Ca2+-binding RTX toxin-like protein